MSAYEIDSAINKLDFIPASKEEILADSIYNEQDKTTDSLIQSSKKNKELNLLSKTDFKNNKARIYINQKQSYTDSSNFLSAPCLCEIFNDTLSISMNVGFFGSAQFKINVYQSQYKSSVFLYSGRVQLYKRQNDSTFANSILLKNKIERLILNKKFESNKNDALFGQLLFTTEAYNENSKQTPQLDSIKGKIFFKCLPKLKKASDF
ncbi:MAG: hypothetical protein SFU21_13680 [Flavihumibacter sp.]|nr:hypothetical protein [Flavihumibacter sp.]